MDAMPAAIHSAVIGAAVTLLVASAVPSANAASAAPSAWPTVRAVAMIPEATVTRSRGTLVFNSRLLGAWKKPKPRPHNTVRHAMSQTSVVPARASKARPHTMTARPHVHSVGAW
jgi:hypothetical protein